MKKNQLMNLALIITERCTLRCKLCATFCPSKTGELFDMSLEDYCNIIDNIFAVVDEIDELGLTGGEALLNKDLSEILTYTLKYKDRIKRLSLITNGTILPIQKVVDVLKNGWSDKLTFHISDYGELSNKITEVEKIIQQSNLKYRILNFNGEGQHSGGWVDFTDHSLKYISDEEVAGNAKYCRDIRNPNFIITKSGMYKCARAAERMRLEIIPANKEEYIDIINEKLTKEQFNNRINAILEKDYFESCRYCVGLNPKAKRYPAAEQL